LGFILNIRLKQLQYAEWLIADNPLDIWHYSNPTNFKNNFTAQILCAMNQLGISFKFEHFHNSPEFLQISLFDIFKQDYRKIKDSLKKRNLVNLNQLLLNGDSLFTKEHMNNFSKFQQKGRTPFWWTKLENIVIEDYTISPQFIPNLPQHMAYRNMNRSLATISKIDGRKNSWVVCKENKKDQIKIGFLSNNSQITDPTLCYFQHFYIEKQKNWNLYVKPYSNPNCSSGNLNSNNLCFITATKSQILYIQSKVDKDGDTYVIKQTYLSILIELEKLYQKNTEIPLLSIDLLPITYRKIIFKKIYSLDNDKTTELLNIAEQLISSGFNTFKVYTDGSLSRTLTNNLNSQSSSHIQQGFGWIFIRNNTPLISFKGASLGWASSS
jgi:hypothetical protein